MKGARLGFLLVKPICLTTASELQSLYQKRYGILIGLLHGASGLNESIRNFLYIFLCVYVMKAFLFGTRRITYH